MLTDSLCQTNPNTGIKIKTIVVLSSKFEEKEFE